MSEIPATAAAQLAILGGGQLGCMLADAADRLGIATRIVDRSATVPAATRPGFRATDDWLAALAELDPATSVATWEREDLPVAELAAAPIPLAPAAGVLARTQDRLHQKRLLDELAIATAPWHPADAVGQVDAIVDSLGLPVMVKARRGGFDGRGQRIARDRDELAAAIAAYAEVGAIAEQLVAFDDEFAILVTRGHDGTIVDYPLVWTCQHDGQLAWALAPHPRAEALAAWAEPVAGRIVSALEHVGTLAVECFRVGDRAVVNELAPRVHNSGHWTIEGCTASQFENHVRAVCALPLVAPEARGLSLLLNAIGSMPDRERTGALHRHDYGKADRPRRKVGHLTLVADDRAELAAGLSACDPDWLAAYALPDAITGVDQRAGPRT